jgi:hypothetical protein
VSALACARLGAALLDATSVSWPRALLIAASCTEAVYPAGSIHGRQLVHSAQTPRRNPGAAAGVPCRDKWDNGPPPSTGLTRVQAGFSCEKSEKRIRQHL